MEVVNRSIKLTDDVMPQTLGIMDQLKLLAKQFSNEDLAELDSAEKISAHRLQMQATLASLIEKAVARMQQLGEDSVWLEIPSEYEPYIEAVTNPKTGRGRFYDIKTYASSEHLALKHVILMRVSVRR